MNNQAYRTNSRSEYMYNRDNLAYSSRQQEAYPVPERRQQPLREVRRHQQPGRRHRMDLGYAIFLTAAVFVTAILLLGYVKLQSDYVTVKKQVSEMEKEYNNIKASNDETEKRINNSIDLNRIRKIAIEELGMIYAKEGQVVIITDEGSDYVRQLKSID